MPKLLEIHNLTVASSQKTILHDISLSINPSEIHVVMGPNGSGKSTLCLALAGHPSFSVISGKVTFDGHNLLSLKPHERAQAGLFLSFQYPREIPGVSLAAVVRASLHTRATQKQSARRASVLKQLKEQLALLKLSDDFISRPLNENTSGGEKKRLEMAQLGMLMPKLAILDEIDSGLDVDALKLFASLISRYAKEQKTAFLIVTHYQRLLDYLQPHKVHVLINGRIVRSGYVNLAKEVEALGYAHMKP